MRLCTVDRLEAFVVPRDGAGQERQAPDVPQAVRQSLAAALPAARVPKESMS
ncbi:MAG: hypothetical protein M0035_14940 [Actinomycetota bacterium]|nr:hypothetical protein [Actinomycetota bacterium]